MSFVSEGTTFITDELFNSKHLRLGIGMGHGSYHLRVFPYVILIAV